MDMIETKEASILYGDVSFIQGITQYGSTVYTSKCCNLEREYRDCIKSRRDKIGITRHIMMHQVLYNVHVTLFIGQLHNI